MTPSFFIRKLLLASAIATVLITPSIQASPDELGQRWSERSALASKHMAEPGLDACDLAIDRAFAHPKEGRSDPFRSFVLDADVGGQALSVSYSFRQGRLASFELVSLPAGWIARQRAGSKTLTVLVAPAHCAMDFCTDDPFAVGACAGDTPE
jgi:hypothetical protein